MGADEKPPSSPERAHTDESLRLEREKVGDALEETVDGIEETADAVVTTARERADELLAAARAGSDRQRHSLVGQTLKTLADARELEDQVLQEEREDADEIVRAERAERSSLLAAERDQTDQGLFLERHRSDNALATRDQFLAIVSHDLRNMLGAMTGFASLIATAEAKDDHAEAVLAYVQRIHRAGAQMNRLIGDLLDLASIEAGRLAVTPDVCDPARLLTEALDTLAPDASAKGVSLTADCGPPAMLASLDRERILQVLTNLLSNALKFTPVNGEVMLRLEHLSHELRFTVRDTGAGIPPEKLEAVFERYHQVKPNDRRGSGRGLYIAKCIVQGHGGRIWVESTVGEGSTFYFTLPLHAGTL